MNFEIGSAGQGSTLISMLSIAVSAFAVVLSAMSLLFNRGASREKMRLDLFEKRLEAWEAVNAGLAEQITYAMSYNDASGKVESLPGSKEAFHAARRVKLLFGDEVHGQVRAIEALSTVKLGKRWRWP